MPSRRLKGREAEVIAGYEAGESVDELTERFGVSNFPIRRILIQGGVTLRRTGRRDVRPDEADMAKIIDAYRRGVRPVHLAREWDVDVKSIRRWLRDAGVTRDQWRLEGR